MRSTRLTWRVFDFVSGFTLLISSSCSLHFVFPRSFHFKCVCNGSLLFFYYSRCSAAGIYSYLVCRFSFPSVNFPRTKHLYSSSLFFFPRELLLPQRISSTSDYISLLQFSYTANFSATDFKVLFLLHNLLLQTESHCFLITFPTTLLSSQY